MLNKLQEYKIQLAQNNYKNKKDNDILKAAKSNSSIFFSDLDSEVRELEDHYINYIKSNELPSFSNQTVIQTILKADIQRDMIAEEILQIDDKEKIANRLKWLKKTGFIKGNKGDHILDIHSKDNKELKELVLNDLINNLEHYDPEVILSVSSLAFNENKLSLIDVPRELKDKLFLASYEAYSRLEDTTSFKPVLDEMQKTSYFKKRLTNLKSNAAAQATIDDINLNYENYLKRKNVEGFGNKVPLKTVNSKKLTDIGLDTSLLSKVKKESGVTITPKTEKDLRVNTNVSSKAKDKLVTLCNKHKDKITREPLVLGGDNWSYYRIQDGKKSKIFTTRDFPSTKIDFSSTPKNEIEFELAALAVAGSGITKPFINCLEDDATLRKRFVIGHLTALTNAGYDIDDIYVDKNSQGILNEFKNSFNNKNTVQEYNQDTSPVNITRNSNHNADDFTKYRNERADALINGVPSDYIDPNNKDLESKILDVRNRLVEFVKDLESHSNALTDEDKIRLTVIKDDYFNACDSMVKQTGNVGEAYHENTSVDKKLLFDKYLNARSLALGGEGIDLVKSKEDALKSSQEFRQNKIDNEASLTKENNSIVDYEHDKLEEPDYENSVLSLKKETDNPKPKQRPKSKPRV